MKILAIIGSPKKKGNTYHVVEKIKEQLLCMDENINWEYLFLQDCDLKMCRGCFNCIGKGEDKCPLCDDRSAIEARMLEADGIIFASPNYAMGVPGLMKNFIDRFAYTLHRPCFFDKAFLAVTTSGGPVGIKQTLNQLAILSTGGKGVQKLGVSMPPVPMKGSGRKTAKSIVKAAGAFYHTMQKPGRKVPGFMDWAYFHSFKTMSAFQSYQKECPADHQYYGGKTEYFYPLDGHGLRRLGGKAVRGLMRAGMKLMVDER